MQYSKLFSRSELYQAVSDGLVRINTHPDLPIGILNYTEKCVYDRAWSETTLWCRGLIIDFESGEIVAWPMKKFFNSVEHQPANEWAPKLPDEPFEIFDKVDGSMITVFYYLDRWLAASKGSFTSNQAVWAQEMINGRTIELHRDHTYVAELIVPENRIVVDYGDRQDLVLLFCRDNRNGEEVSLDATRWRLIGSTVRHMGPMSAKWLKSLESFASKGKDLNGEKVSGTQAEGYVVRFLSGVRAKVKLYDYLEAHKLFTQTNERTVWNWLKTGQPIGDILAIVPDEYADWVRKVAAELNETHADLLDQVVEAHEEIMAVLPAEPSRKDFAVLATKYKTLSGALFAYHDGQGNKVSDWAWKQLRPEGQTPTAFSGPEA